MKIRNTLAITCLVSLALIVTGILLTAAAAAKAKPTSEAVKNGPKAIPPGWERVVFVHYRKNAPDGPEHPGKGPKPPKEDAGCYTFLKRGVKWVYPEHSAFVIAATNEEGLGATAIENALFEAAAAWRDETAADVFLSCLLSPEPLEANWDAPDYVNEVVFGDIDQPGAIAVTIVWGIFGGPPSDRGIKEFDIVFDDEDFDWSTGDTPDPAKMDLQNIATHELGHGLGLGDLYGRTCSDVTMYGYSSYGETKKRTLEPADVAGLQELYGE